VIRLTEVREFALPLATPFGTAAGRIDERRGFLIRITDGESEGVGEATPLPGWTESGDDCRAALSRIEEVTDDALAGIDAPAARHGLSFALADLRARREGVSLVRWLGADPGVESVAVNATIGDCSAGVAAERAIEATSDGFATLKLKVGVRSVTEDVERVREVRAAVGNDVDLRLDANGAWDREEARSALDAFSEFDPEYVEQPLSETDLDGAEALETGVPIALDESLAACGLDSCLEVADVLVCKPMALGGPDRVQWIAEQARERGVGVVLTTTVDGVVARLGALALAAALAPGTTHGLATGDLLAEDLGTDPAPLEDGSIRLPTDPGLGIEWGDLRV
jgi:L-Ala-D/L-Glu epimerase